jgi:hypothetical protein
MVLGHEERVAELGFTHFAFSSNINKSWAFLSHGEDVVVTIFCASHGAGIIT